MSVAYLSCPYFDPDSLVKETRHIMVTRAAFELMKQGIMVYSPLTHNLPIDRLGIHGDWKTWREFDHTMLSKCDRVIVLKLPGWENSKGVAAEIARAEELGLPIEWMEVDEVKYQNALAIAASFHKDLLDKLQVFNAEREWEQFHSPKNLAMNLGVEAGELMEHFRWMTEPQSYVKCPQKLAEIRDELGDVYLVLLQLAHNLGIELHQAAHDKLSKIAKKYPVEHCKGLSHKYTEYESELRITAPIILTS